MAKVLIVDDALFMRTRTSRMLVDAGHEVCEAENGRIAVEVYQRERPDAVLMDITMPEMDGLTALAEIRRLDPSAKVSMLSAIGQQSVVMDAIKRGASGFVVKPPQPEEILKAIARMVPA